MFCSSLSVPIVLANDRDKFRVRRFQMSKFESVPLPVVDQLPNQEFSQDPVLKPSDEAFRAVILV